MMRKKFWRALHGAMAMALALSVSMGGATAYAADGGSTGKDYVVDAAGHGGDCVRDWKDGKGGFVVCRFGSPEWEQYILPLNDGDGHGHASGPDGCYKVTEGSQAQEPAEDPGGLPGGDPAGEEEPAGGKGLAGWHGDACWQEDILTCDEDYEHGEDCYETGFVAELGGEHDDGKCHVFEARPFTLAPVMLASMNRMNYGMPGTPATAVSSNAGTYFMLQQVNGNTPVRSTDGKYYFGAGKSGSFDTKWVGYLGSDVSITDEALHVIAVDSSGVERELELDNKICKGTDTGTNMSVKFSVAVDVSELDNNIVELYVKLDLPDDTVVASDHVYRIGYKDLPSTGGIGLSQAMLFGMSGLLLGVAAVFVTRRREN